LHLRHDAEHQPAVQTQEAVGQGNQLQIAESESFDCGFRIADCGLLELHEHAVRRGRVDERDGRPLGAWPWPLVDHAHAARSELCNRRVEIIDP
jgi:hypothetical protein